MAITRDLQITYAGVTIGGSSARQIEGYYISGPKGFETAAIEFSFITTAASAAAPAAECVSLEAAFRTPRQALVVTLAGNTLLSLSHSANTGFDSQPTIIKSGDPADTGRSRHYTVRIDFGMPADNTSTAFRRNSTISVEVSPAGRQRVTITGTYTANTDGTTAYGQYNAAIAAYATSVLSVVDSGATFERIGVPQIAYNDTNKVCDFSVVYQECLHAQSGSGLNDPDIIDPTLSINVGRVSPGDSTEGSLTATSGGGVGFEGGDNGSTVVTIGTPGSGGPSTQGTPERPRPVTLTFSCHLDKDTVSSMSAMTGKYTGALRSYLIGEASQAAQGGLVLVEEHPVYEFHHRTLQVTMDFLLYRSSLIESTITVSDSMQHQKILKPVWNGDPYAYYEYQGPAIKQRIITEEFRKQVGSADPYQVLTSLQGQVNDTPGGIYSSAEWVFVSKKPSVNVKVQGLDGGIVVNIAEVRLESVLMRRNKKGPSSFGGGGGGTPTGGGGRPPISTG